MGRTKRPEHTQTPKNSQQRPLDGFLQPQAGSSGSSSSPKMATSPASEQEIPALSRIESSLRDLTASAVTKSDLQAITTAIQETLRTEIAGIRTELTSQAGRITAVEEASEALTARVAATDTAVAHQGEMLLSVRRHLEDVDNRGRRCNIRVRGVPETEGPEDAVAILTELFCSLLQPSPPTEIEFERAHRALRPRTVEEGPRDLICCLHSFPVKNTIMLKARERHQNRWLTLRWPEEVPRFMGELDLPSPPVPDWILGSLNPQPRPQRGPRQRGMRAPPVQRAGGRGDPTSPEE
ncbi:Hypothetical predicted protein [Pelobates cultripes]|uniref:L1 transposable element RRM domain-containing protein n=1 Tax=Pelobates cultripes TaxID=61616 RepID=A0AAD1R1L8_PELCU|nr:Hypothetical predicted protein [Pelobates cultripes]